MINSDDYDDDYFMDCDSSIDKDYINSFNKIIEARNNFLEKEIPNNKEILTKLFGLVKDMSGYNWVYYNEIVDLKHFLFNDEKRKWIYTFYLYQNMKEDKVFNLEELVELLAFYYCIFDDLNTAVGNVHMLTGAICCILENDEAAIENYKNIVEEVTKYKINKIGKIFIKYDDKSYIIYLNMDKIKVKESEKE